MISQPETTFLRRMHKMNPRRACTGETQLQPRNFIRFVGLSPRLFKVQRGPREPAKGLLKPAFRPHASCPNKPSGTCSRRKSDPEIFVVQSAKDWEGYNASYRLDGSGYR